MRRPLLDLAVAAAAAGGAAAAGAGLRAWPPGGAQRWQRLNSVGRSVTLLEGPAAVAGAVLGLAVAAGADRSAPGPWRTVHGAGRPLAPRFGPVLRSWAPARVSGRRAALAACVAALGAAYAGWYDDAATGPAARVKGLRGHLGRLRYGEVTPGAMKLAGIGAASLTAARLLGRGPGWGSFDVLCAGSVIAGSANLVNLLDLRPGRAAKALLLAGGALLPGRGGPVAAAALGATAAVLPADLAARSMLGDLGANALGAVVGTAAAAGSGRAARVGLAVGLAGLTLLSERVSFSVLINRVPVLRRLDRLGRSGS